MSLQIKYTTTIKDICAQRHSYKMHTPTKSHVHVYSHLHVLKVNQRQILKSQSKIKNDSSK